MEATTFNVEDKERSSNEARVSDEAARASLDPERSASPIEEIRRALEAKPFKPHPLFRGGHAQTLRGYFRPRKKIELNDEDEEARLFEVEQGVKILAHCIWQKGREEKPTLLLAHGLEGSSSSRYMLGTARKAARSGFNVVRLNLRNCGDTEHLTSTLYHSGMSGDVLAVARELAERDRLSRIFLAGFSLGGNLVLKLAGEAGEKIMPQIAGVAAVSASLDLEACADAIERRANVLYQWSFMRSLRRRIERKARMYPNVYDASRIRGMRTIRQFDEAYTAPHAGFRDAADYYARSSSLQFIERIRVPTLIIHAQNDPFIPFSSLRHPCVGENPNIILLAPKSGGHVGFIARSRPDEDAYWAENRIAEFCSLLERKAKGERLRALSGDDER